MGVGWGDEEGRSKTKKRMGVKKKVMLLNVKTSTWPTLKQEESKAMPACSPPKWLKALVSNNKSLNYYADHPTATNP